MDAESGELTPVLCQSRTAHEEQDSKLPVRSDKQSAEGRASCPKREGSRKKRVKVVCAVGDHAAVVALTGER
jgi:hypothetical protein